MQSQTGNTNANINQGCRKHQCQLLGRTSFFMGFLSFGLLFNLQLKAAGSNVMLSMTSEVIDKSNTILSSDNWQSKSGP